MAAKKKAAKRKSAARKKAARKKVAKRKASAKKKAGKKKWPRKNDPRNIPGMVMWQPGQSGNPKGRPKGKKLETIVLELLAKKMKLDGENVLGMEAMARIFLHEAMVKRNSVVLKEMLARLWPAGVEVNLNPKGGFTIIFDELDKGA